MSKTVSTTAAKVAAAKTVTVGLKSPNGIILRLFKPEKQMENTPAGPRAFQMDVPDLKAGTIELKGYGGAAFGVKQDHRIIGQYALTPNVDAAFMREWLKQNEEHELVVNKLIFIQADESDAVAQGTEQRGVWDGLHPLRMHSAKKDPRVPKRVRTMTKKDDDDGGDVISAPAAQSAAA